MVDLSSDGRVVIRAEDSVAAGWALVDVDVMRDHRVTEFHVAGDRIDFELDDRENPEDKDRW